MNTKHSNSKLFYLVDDDALILDTVSELLLSNGHTVHSNSSSKDALSEIISLQPDCVILDIMMPDIDGLELCEQLRKHESLASTSILMLSAKPYEFDRKRAYQLGADGYINKPINTDTFNDQVTKLLQGNMNLTFWGVRGTLPVPGEGTVKYGGNTSCVSVSFPKEREFIFDAGSGIKSLSDFILSSKKGKLSGKIFISHPHWDHINALPFFAPLYIPGNEVEILGPAQGKVSIREQISAQMDNVYFPITIKEFAARVYFTDLREETYDVDGIEVRTLLLKHPGNCLGYRVNFKGRSFCYITDNELFLESDEYYDELYLQKLTGFIEGTDALITDCTYFDNEYPSKVGWGHSSIGEVVKLAHQATVKNLYLFHHDPDHKDADIDRKLDIAEKMLASMGSTTRCIAPKEKLTISI